MENRINLKNQGESMMCFIPKDMPIAYTPIDHEEVKRIVKFIEGIIIFIAGVMTGMVIQLFIV